VAGRLLVVDFDFFLPNPMEARDIEHPHRYLYDWGHGESPFFLSNMLWSTRACGFLAYGLPLPMAVPPDGGWPAFWSRFTFADHAVMGYADSNMHAGRMPPSTGKAFKSVTLLDAHHDSGYDPDIADIQEWEARNVYDCSDWMLLLQTRGCKDLTVRYPTWKPTGPDEAMTGGSLTKQIVDDGKRLRQTFDRVVICRSGGWVPPWCDHQFLEFLDACPVEGYQMDRTDLNRNFDQDALMAAMPELPQNLRLMIGAAPSQRPD